MFDLDAVRRALTEFGPRGWLLYDFRGSNVLARRVLGIDESAITSRRFFYYIPAEGEPTKIVHRIESGVLDHLPGRRRVYLRWTELEAALAETLPGEGRVAMEYSPGGANPYVSKVDAGTVEMARRTGVEVVSSGDLVQRFEATWSDRQWSLHRQAAEGTDAAFAVAWTMIEQSLARGETVTERDVQQRIVGHFAERGLVTEHPPIVAVNEHSGDPHYEPSPERPRAIEPGDFVLIDLWAKRDDPDGVYSDLTRVAMVGAPPTPRHVEVFAVVAAARDAAIACVRDSLAAGRSPRGWEVDQAARDVIEAAGFGEYFVHRTGHSIGRELHGNGANMDNLETREDRQVLPRTCFSIEPGIYLPEFGVRSEVNVFVDAHRVVHVTGGVVQREIRVLRGSA